jgi:zinc protease
MKALARFARSRVGRGPWTVGRISIVSAVVATVVVIACATAPQTPKKEAAMPKLERQAVVLPVPADPTVSFSIAFAVGSQDDPAGKEGLAYLTATLMAEGATARHSYADILRLLYPMAADYGVRIDKERTTFTGRVHRDSLDAYSALLLDAVLRPAFADDDFRRIRQRAVDYLEKSLRYASDEDLGKAALYNTVFAGTPYGHINQGTVAGLKAITPDDVRAFYRARFVAGAATLGVGGGYPASLGETLQAQLGALPAGSAAPAAAPRPTLPAGRQAVLVAKPGQSTAISFGFPITVRRGEREFYALWLANSWLGEHRNSSSHLYQVIREARGMNYGDYSYIEWFPEGGMRQMPAPGVPRRQQLFEVWVRPVSNAQAHFALRAAVREVEKLAANGLTREQFELTREFLSKYCLHFAETTSTRLGYAMDDSSYGMPPLAHLNGFRTIVPTLTLEEVNAAIRTHLRPESMTIAIVTQDAGAHADALAAETPSPMTYGTPKPPEVLAEDKEIAVYPLHLTRAAIRVVPVEEMFAR